MWDLPDDTRARRAPAKRKAKKAAAKKAPARKVAKKAPTRRATTRRAPAPKPKKATTKRAPARRAAPATLAWKKKKISIDNTGKAKRKVDAEVLGGTGLAVHKCDNVSCLAHVPSGGRLESGSKRGMKELAERVAHLADPHGGWAGPAVVAALRKGMSGGKPPAWYFGLFAAFNAVSAEVMQ